MNSLSARTGYLALALSFATTAGAQEPSDTTTGAEADTSSAPETPPLATIPVAATEETAPEESPASGSRSRLVEEIVVTAQKREENLRDVPISIAAFSAESLDARGAFDTKALAQITPAVSITDSAASLSSSFAESAATPSFLPQTPA